MNDPIETAKHEIDRAQRTVEEVKAEFARASEELAGGPAETPEEAARQVADLRARLDWDLQTLRGRIPDPREIGEQAKRTALAVAGGVGALVGVVVLLRKRGEKRRHERAVEESARAIAAELIRLQADRLHRASVSAGAVDDTVGRIVDEVVEEDAASERRTGRWLLVLGVLAGAGVAVATRRQPLPPHSHVDPVDAAVPGPPRD
jgi:hypothetical protein